MVDGEGSRLGGGPSLISLSTRRPPKPRLRSGGCSRWRRRIRASTASGAPTRRTRCHVGVGGIFPGACDSRDDQCGNWLLYTNDEDIGYWPREIFNNMGDAFEAQIYGVFYSPFDEPSPPMGSGVLYGAAMRQFLLMDGKEDRYNFDESNTTETFVLTEEEEMELDRELQSLNKPFVTSFEDEYGITYDCVDFYKQPAFDHPLLKNHTPLQLNATRLPRVFESKASKKQMFPKRCPEGTVLIRRTTKEDLIREKMYKPIQAHQEQSIETQAASDGAFHFAGRVIHSAGGRMIYGAVVTMDVYQISGSVSNNQMSNAQLVFVKGRNGPKNYLNVLQAGWHVDYSHEGDNRVHFFTYWTSDGYQRTGCYNLRCKGFVQTGRGLTPGMDDHSGDWQLYTDDEDIGYWPREIFNNMGDASEVQIDGLVYSPFNVPSPPMGSGKFFAAGMRDFLLMKGNGDKYNFDASQIQVLNDLGPKYYGDYFACNSGAYCVLRYGGPGGWKKA
ncbi:hypothetical protein Cni_G17449 [Canna indica]|uniref:Neprosin PEP catalytic domain-containing protein n=1 Tax=Canna indica TaxID=4628 RepID=A0AAQ3KMQ6_9LILI|nr:hypothetical protein Cni_G17449 [Canna indica]